MLKLLYGCAEFALKLNKNCAEILFFFSFSQERWKFSTDVLNLCWNFARNTLKFFYFHVFSKVQKLFYGCAEFALKLNKNCAEILFFFSFSQELWKFSTDGLNLCWNFARNALKFFYFHVFSKVQKLFYGCAEFALKINKNYAEILIFYDFSRALKVFYWCAEFVLKLCKKCAQIFLFSRFFKNAETFQRICWICAETLWEMRWNFIVLTFSQERWSFSTDVVNLCWNFARNALKFYCFHVFSKVLKLLYGCAEFALKLNKNCAEILFFFRFLKSAESFLLMCGICAETLQEMRWIFFIFTFSQRCRNFSTDMLTLRWHLIRIVLKFYYFTFSQELWKFSTDVLILCWNFARNTLKFFYFHVFSKVLNVLYGCAKFALKLNKNCAEILFFFSFSQERWKFSTDVLNLCWNFARNALNFFYFHVFSKVPKLLYGYADFALTLNKNCAEILFFYVFSRALKVFYW